MADQFNMISHTANIASIKDLPDDMVTHILSLLDGPTLASLSCASSSLYSLSSDPTIWHDLSLSMWPSLDHSCVRSLSIPHRSLIADAFPFPSMVLPPRTVPSNHLPKQLISAIDICHSGRTIFSRVLETDASSPWFHGIPFRFTALEKNAEATATLPIDEVRSPDKLTLSWILIDPSRSRSVNLSSRLPVAIACHRPTGETQVRFGIVLEGLLILIVVTCSEKTKQLSEVSLTVEDDDGLPVNGKRSLEILNRAMEGQRRNRGDEVVLARKQYDDFTNLKRRRKESKASKELLLDFCCSTAGASLFYLVFAVLFG